MWDFSKLWGKRRTASGKKSTKKAKKKKPGKKKHKIAKLKNTKKPSIFDSWPMCGLQPTLGRRPCPSGHWEADARTRPQVPYACSGGRRTSSYLWTPGSPSFHVWTGKRQPRIFWHRPTTSSVPEAHQTCLSKRKMPFGDLTLEMLGGKKECINITPPKITPQNKTLKYNTSPWQIEQKSKNKPPTTTRSPWQRKEEGWEKIFHEKNVKLLKTPTSDTKVIKLESD